MTLFTDGLGRTISRDPNILRTLVEEYRRSNLMLLAQAGKEIEYLMEQLEFCKKTQIPVTVTPKPAVKATKPPAPKTEST